MESDIRNRQLGCLLCGIPMQAVLQNLSDDRFGSPGTFSIAECRRCGLLQTYPVPDSKQLKYLYETYYNFGGEKETVYTKFRDIFFESVVYRFWMAIDGDISLYTRRGKGRLLDFGCNEGRGMRIYRSNGYTPEGLEINENAAYEARIAGFTVHTKPLEELFLDEPFDIVVLSNVIEHSTDPKAMLENIHRVLKPGGTIWVSCPNSQSWLCRLFGRSWINWHVPFHIFHFSRTTLTQLLQSVGFHISNIEYVTPSHWMAQSMIATFSAKYGQRTHFLRSPLPVIFLMFFCRFLLFPFLLIGNLREKGDCLIVEAKSK